MGATNRLYACLGEPKVSYLSFLDQLFHGAGHVFDRDARIDAVLIEQIDDFDP
jgi:hypothetical protein